MHFNIGAALLGAFALLASTGLAADSAVWVDPETGFTFSQYAAAFEIGKTVTFRLAIPSTATASAPYDAVLQIAAPIAVGWTGIAWGGTMVTNPLTVGWANGNSAVATARWATGATLQVLKTGTHTNSTHWQVTFKCTGCTSFASSTSGNKTLTPTGSNRLAFAYSKSKPTTPSSGSSSFPVHDVTNYWNHDFSTAMNSNFAALVTKNS
ncbi:hypothetical protein E8E14_002718 [Neopestalotiopsis sp. 37M]|nr:hypothetical protein E8E14_002718 [Neopestalotiopsis sp. 37M]